MDRSVFEVARNETPEMRTKHLREHLFKPGGAVPTDIPAPVLKSESEIETEPPREYGRRTIKGKLPMDKFPPARPRRVINTPEHQARFDTFIMQSETESAPATVDRPAPPKIPERVIEPSPPEVVPGTVPEPIHPNESDNDMNKGKSTTAKAAPSKALKGSRGIPASPASAKIFDTLFAAHQKGESYTHSEYEKEFGKVERTTFYSARMKLDRITNKKKGPTGRGKPTEVFSPAPAAGGNGARVEILYTADTSPKADIMEELKKILPVVLAAFSASAGIPIDVSELEIKNFAPAGYEIRRKVR